MKKVKMLLLALSMVFCMSACGAQKEEPDTSKEISADAYPVTITDQAGRTVTIEKEPQTLVSSYYITTSLLIALELDDRMVGIEAKANARPLYQWSAKNIIDLPSVGTAKELDLESCAALNPDLVILPLKLKNAADSLEELGITTILVNPESDELMTEMIELVATATNTKSRAEELISYIDEKKQMLADATQAVEPKNVYLSGNSSFLLTAGNKMYQNGMIALAGGKNVAEEFEDTYWAEVSYEQLLAWNPDYIVIAANATYTVEDIMNDEAIASCSAVQNNRVYKLPLDVEAWDSPVPSGILGSVWIASVLHPEIISEETRESMIEEYYERFYDFKYSEK